MTATVPTRGGVSAPAVVAIVSHSTLYYGDDDVMPASPEAWPDDVRTAHSEGRISHFRARQIIGARAVANAAKVDGETVRNQEIQDARDAQPCTCGHRNVSHAYAVAEDAPAWPDGSRIGMGACGIDRDTRNAATGWLGDPCPCEAFTVAAP